MITTYTILDGTGEMIKTGLSLRDAAHEILTSDGREYDIRADNHGHALWSRDRGRWTRTRFESPAADRAAAEREIFDAVVMSDRLPGHVEAVPESR